MRIPHLPLPTQPWKRMGVLALGVALVAGSVVVGVRQFTGLPADAALSFDGKVVTQADLADRVDVLGALYGIEEPTGAKEQAAFRRDVAKAVAVSLILDKAATAHDIVISDKSARDTLSSMARVQLGDDPRAFTELLGKFGVSENDVLAELKRQQAIARLFQEVTRHAVDSATAGDVRDYFDEDPARFAVPEQRNLRNIVVASSKDASVVLARARQGVDFGGLARRTSLDDATRDKLGALGTVTAAQLDPTFAKAAFAAPAGELFGPVKSALGWNVGLVRKVVPGRNVDFASVRDQVTDVVRSERALAAWRDWLVGEIQHADVEYAGDYLPAHPDDPPADDTVGQIGTSSTGPSGATVPAQ